MSYEIVIARYNEDLSWLKKIPKSIKITIYNKGKDDIEYPFIKLPNIGRESHTYLYHIIQNYDILADNTIFCQGDSIFHSPGFIDLLKNRKSFQPVQPLSAFYWPEGEEPFYFYNPPKPVLNKTKNLWIKKNPIHVEYLDNNFVTRFPYLYQQHHFIKLVELVKKIYNIDNVFKYFVERFRLKDVDLNDLFPICYAGLFCIHKKVILENSIDFYNNIMSMLLYDFRYDTRFSKNNNITIPSNTKPLDWGLFLEKLWLVIFNYKKYNSNYIKLKVNDFPIYNYNLTIKNNYIHFKLFIIVCELYINLIIDNQHYSINISKNIIFIKHNNKTLLKYSPINNKNIQNIIKNTNNINVEIKLINNNLTIYINDYKIINFTFKYKVNTIQKAKIFSITNDNKFIDILESKTNLKNRELNTYL